MNGVSTPTSPNRSPGGKMAKRVLLRRLAAVLALLGAVVVVHIGYVGSRIDPHVYSADELRAGPRVQVISWPGGQTGVQANQLMSAVDEQVWAVVRDQRRFSEFMPYVKSAVEAERQDQSYQLRQRLALPHSTYENLLRMDESADDMSKRLGWRQIEGPSEFNEGNWIVERHGEQSILRYQLSVRIRGIPQWLSNYVMLSRLPRITAAIEKRVREIGSRPPADSGDDS